MVYMFLYGKVHVLRLVVKVFCVPEIHQNVAIKLELHVV